MSMVLNEAMRDSAVDGASASTRDLSMVSGVSVGEAFETVLRMMRAVEISFERSTALLSFEENGGAKTSWIRRETSGRLRDWAMRAILSAVLSVVF